MFRAAALESIYPLVRSQETFFGDARNHCTREQLQCKPVLQLQRRLAFPSPLNWGLPKMYCVYRFATRRQHYFGKALRWFEPQIWTPKTLVWPLVMSSHSVLLKSNSEPTCHIKWNPVQVSVCVMYICMCVCVYICVYAWRFVRVCVYMWVCQKKCSILQKICIFKTHPLLYTFVCYSGHSGQLICFRTLTYSGDYWHIHNFYVGVFSRLGAATLVRQVWGSHNCSGLPCGQPTDEPKKRKGRTFWKEAIRTKEN